jgi:hypothetical protein
LIDISSVYYDTTSPPSAPNDDDDDEAGEGMDVDEEGEEDEKTPASPRFKRTCSYPF